MTLHLRPPEGDRLEPLVRVARALGDDELRVLAAVAARLALGQVRYGPFNLATDPRDFRTETADELLDATVYLAVQALRAER